MNRTIEACGLEKTFIKKRSIRELALHPWRRAERIRALRGVDLHVGEGELVSLLGPNGAGKTTLLKILSCLVLPDAGQAIVAGAPTSAEHLVKPFIGLVHSDERSFYWRLSARENLRFFAALYDVPSRRVESRVTELLSRVELLDAADRPFADYSSGMKQRVAIARALLHDPPILLMDEPTRSLDPASSLVLREFIRRELRQRDGKTILLATHNLREAEALSDRVAILVAGRVRQMGTVEAIRRWGLESERYQIELDPGGPALTGPFRVLDDTTQDGARRITLALEAGARVESVMRAALDAGAGIRAFARLEPDLEAAFQRIVGGEEVAT